MKAEDVAAYLKEHPEFYEEYAYLLMELVIPHPHGGRAISIGERQVLALREKVKVLESKLGELIQFGEENDAVGEKVHRITLALMMARDLESLLYSIYFNLREDFAVPHVALRLWGDVSHFPELPEFEPVSNELRVYADNLTNPSCSAHALYDTMNWFGENSEHLRSFAMVALREEQAFGLLLLASEDPERFYPEMGTLYLKRLGELISVALMRTLKGS